MWKIQTTQKVYNVEVSLSLKSLKNECVTKCVGDKWSNTLMSDQISPHFNIMACFDIGVDSLLCSACVLLDGGSVFAEYITPFLIAAV